ncbi:hypothetical protein [Maritimibacter alkaliphilus]|uniref:Uncharacterized protein n=1 Tax=Maritimibacter alkaliphilus HTCC2654 TaxID=314271 RepID=A3VAV7_9RHOB|nr:hypothetical protein [Maritimibacter alkaliphilus]EAQ15048.1 hypothetical protein RB2654_20733 [Maritimibacter alkaliphilus HTCC2654]
MQADIEGSMRITYLTTLCLYLLASTGFAQPDLKYAPIVYDSRYPGILALWGDIDERTTLNFERAMEEFGTPSLVMLNSDGGLVTSALLMARRVRSIGADTFIPKDAGCYSACAFVFFAGVVRDAQGELGVHQISSDSGDLESGQVSVSDIIDTLSDFDVPNDLLVAMFRTPKDEMYILSRDEKVEYSMVAGAVATPEAKPSPEALAFHFVDNFFRAWSKPNATALPETLRMYNESVSFYGQTYTLGQVAEDKAEFAARWPKRRYRLIGDTVAVSCNLTYCFVRGNYDYTSSSGIVGDASAGTAFIEVTLLRRGDSFLIVREHGRVVTRR